MSDPLRTDQSRALDAASAVDRDAKIEQLLLAGLDHYFAAQYDQAINVWTRVLFLDRSHPRARAYIDRARSALAERQRESEELLHRGDEAFRRGDLPQARELLLTAIDRGAPSDEASALLDRLSRLEAPASPRDAGELRPAARTSSERPPARRSASAWVTSAIALAIIAAAGFVVADWRRVASFVSDRNAAPRAASVPASHEPLPAPPRRGELALARARGFVSSGHLYDALDALSGVKATDPQRADADRLRADIQRQLLALAPLPPVRSAREKGNRPLP